MCVCICVCLCVCVSVCVCVCVIRGKLALTRVRADPLTLWLSGQGDSCPGFRDTSALGNSSFTCSTASPWRLEESQQALLRTLST